MPAFDLLKAAQAATGFECLGRPRGTPPSKRAIQLMLSGWTRLSMRFANPLGEENEHWELSPVAVDRPSSLGSRVWIPDPLVEFCARFHCCVVACCEDLETRWQLGRARFSTLLSWSCPEKTIKYNNRHE